eukprot:gene1163-1734_t
MCVQDQIGAVPFEMCVQDQIGAVPFEAHVPDQIGAVLFEMYSSAGNDGSATGCTREDGVAPAHLMLLPVTALRLLARLRSWLRPATGRPGCGQGDACKEGLWALDSGERMNALSVPQRMNALRGSQRMKALSGSQRMNALSVSQRMKALSVSQRMKALSERRRYPVCVVLTDFNHDMVRGWAQLPCFAALLAEGLLDFAVLDADVLGAPTGEGSAACSGSVRLQHSQRALGPGSLATPLLVVANYILDSLPCDAFVTSSEDSGARCRPEACPAPADKRQKIGDERHHLQELLVACR